MLLICDGAIWQYGFQSERSAMRIASSPNLRIAAGLLLAVLLSVVGFRVVRRLNSHGPEALLRRADDLSWLKNSIHAEPFNRQAELEFIRQHQLSIGIGLSMRPVSKQGESSSSATNLHRNSRVGRCARSCGGHVFPVKAPTLFLMKAERTAAKACGFATLRAAQFM